MGQPEGQVFRGVFRYTTAPAGPADLPDAGVWTPIDDPVVPPWLKPFGGDVLLATDPETGEYLAGVGIKRHDRFGREISVGTEPAARGAGLARRLVAQAARKIIADGGVPTYLHAPDNHASAKVAAAAGFPDRGWSVYGLGD
jgi:GNAT superfamily N-acetyltransferase